MHRIVGPEKDEVWELIEDEDRETERKGIKRIERELNGDSAHRGTVPEFHRIDSPRSNLERLLSRFMKKRIGPKESET